MVRIGTICRRGVIQKCQYLRNCQSDLLQTWIVYAWGCALPLGCIVFAVMTSWGCTGAQNALGLLFWLEKALKPWKDTTWSDSWVFSWMSSVQHTVTQWYFPSFDGRNRSSIVHRKKSPWKQEFFAQWLPPWFIMKTAWHFQVDLNTTLY